MQSQSTQALGPAAAKGEETMRAQLMPLDGGSPLEITRDLTLVGRQEDCDLRLDHRSVSKMHCVIVRTDGLLLIRDLGSTNGTRVNGQRIRRAALLPNDQLAIAGYKFKVYMGPDDAPLPSNDHTQQLDASEVAHLVRKLAPKTTDSSKGHSALPIQPNALPDVYPEQGSKMSK
jgi:pSer/pThr/pTyr-binding forkhead associated (FHA) protein